MPMAAPDPWTSGDRLVVGDLETPDSHSAPATQADPSKPVQVADDGSVAIVSATTPDPANAQSSAEDPDPVQLPDKARNEAAIEKPVPREVIDIPLGSPKTEALNPPVDATASNVATPKEGGGGRRANNAQPGKGTKGGGQPEVTQKSTKKPDKAEKANKAEPKDPPGLQVIVPQFAAESSFSPRVDIVAVHDIEETIRYAWVFRRKYTPWAGEFRGMTSREGEARPDGSPAGIPRKRRPSAPERNPSGEARVTSQAKPKATDDSHIENWLLSVDDDPTEPTETFVQQDTRDLVEFGTDEAGPSIVRPPIQDEVGEGSPTGLLAPVPEEDDAASARGVDNTPKHGHVRRKPTAPKHKRRPNSQLLDEANDGKNTDANANAMGEGRRTENDHIDDRQSSDRYHLAERRVNWLSEPNMLPAEIKDLRVMCYYYYGPGSVSSPWSPWQYLTERAEDLIERLAERRKSDTINYDEVPIILLGLGFGCLILQRAVDILAESPDKIPGSSEILNLIAGAVLLDAPSPEPEDNTAKKRPPLVFPRSQAQKSKKAWTVDWFEKSGSTAESKIERSPLWQRFSAAAQTNTISVAWHYSLAAQVSSAKELAFDVPGVLFVPSVSKTAHRLSRFEGPGDDDYHAITYRIKSSLLFKCSATPSQALQKRLVDFIDQKFPVDSQDEQGRTALHVAASVPNHEAVARLVFRGKASVAIKNNEGQIPLHVAIISATQKARPPNHPLRGPYINVIKRLRDLSYGNEPDNDGKSPWSYAMGPVYQWILRLRDNSLITGSSSSATTNKLESLNQPTGLRLTACNSFDVTLAELFLRHRHGKLTEKLHLDEVPSVYDVIYKENSGVQQQLALSRPKEVKDRVTCRWVHLPANNEQWVHDLFISMGIQDGSMGGQRNEGSRFIGRYMIPQARRYKHEGLIAPTDFEQPEQP